MEETVFQMVLVDIKRAANDNEIHCIEKPLTEPEEDLKYVALSYRWGELAGTVVDTNLGYLANVTSFHLNDFYALCKMMTREPDLQSINYVWVDAICVDQINYERRKATIYRMTDIYERASYIVAVPDLHLRYLTEINTKNKESIQCTAQYNLYIYYLIKENTAQLVTLDEYWLDGIGVPKNQALRKMLTKHTSHFFGDGLMKHKVHDADYDTKDALYHIRKAAFDTHVPHCRFDFVSTDDDDDGDSTKGDSVHCDWPLYVIKEIKNDKWKQQISQRSASILQSMDFLEDLIKDWSSRVWVINEYNIAKKKNKMKYWFIQLEGQHELDGLCFFEFNFGDLSSLSSRNQDTCIFKSRVSCHALTTKSDFIYQKFRKTMQSQLSQQTFLEMILKSKATRNDDRFHAIFPLSKYKDKLGSKDVVDSWQIISIVAVKLKLFELMDTKDKLDLLFLSGMSSSNTIVLPTFATSRIEWPMHGKYASLEGGGGGGGMYPCNFDLINTTTIQLMPTHTMSTTTCRNENDKTPQYKINLKLHEYYTCRNSVIFVEKVLEKNRTLYTRLQLNDPEDHVDMVCIPSYGDSDKKARRHSKDYQIRQLFLIGSKKTNKWVITSSSVFSLVDTTPIWTLHYTHSNNAGFDIY